MSLPLDMEPSARLSANPEVRNIIVANAELTAVTLAEAKAYGRQPKRFLYPNDPHDPGSSDYDPEMAKLISATKKATKGIINKVIRNMIDRPHVATILWIKGEGGGVGKTGSSAHIIADMLFNPRTVKRFADNGLIADVGYLAMTTVGQDGKKRLAPDGLPLVQHFAPEWDARDISNIRMTLLDTVNMATPKTNYMNLEKYPDQKRATLWVVEDLTGFEGNEPYAVNQDHFAIWRLTDFEAQRNASEQRKYNNQPEKQVLAAQLFEEHGGVVLDRKNVMSSDLFDYMGMEPSRDRAFHRMNGILYAAKEELNLPGEWGAFNLSDLQSNRYFRDQIALPAFYDMRRKVLGFLPGHSIVIPNIFQSGDLYYNFHLIRATQVDSNAVRDFLPKAA